MNNAYISVPTPGERGEGGGGSFKHFVWHDENMGRGNEGEGGGVGLFISHSVFNLTLLMSS